MRRMTAIVMLAACCALGTATTGRAKGPGDETLFVSGWQGGGVYAFRPDTGELVEKTTTPLFNNYFLAWSEQRQELYVAADNGGQICVLKSGPLRMVATITQEVGWNAHALAVSPDGGRLYVSFSSHASDPDGPGNSRVCIYDLETRKLASSLVLSDSRDEAPTIALSSDGGTLYVSRAGAFEVYDAGSLSLVRRSTTKAIACRTLAMSHDGTSAFEATNYRSPGSAAGFDVETMKPLSSPVAPAFTLKMSRFGDRVWVASGHEIVECDANFKVTRRIVLPTGAFDIEESLDGSELYTLVSTWDHEKIQRVQVAVVDLSSGTVARTFDVPKDSQHLLAVSVP